MAEDSTSSIKDVYIRMARYHEWAYKKVIECINKLNEEEYKRDIGLFFKSVHGTLNHLLLVDRLWYTRIALGKPTPEASQLGQELYSNKEELISAIFEQTQVWIKYVESLSEQDIAGKFTYVDSHGISRTAVRGSRLHHAFNHGTHHRGQISAGLTILKHQSPDMDLLYFEIEQEKL